MSVKELINSYSGIAKVKIVRINGYLSNKELGIDKELKIPTFEDLEEITSVEFIYRSNKYSEHEVKEWWANKTDSITVVIK